MNSESENEPEKLSDRTRQTLRDLSKSMLRLHKTLLDAAKIEYEAKNGRIESVSQYFQLVIDDEHFAWLRKISALIALIDEGATIRRAASETQARALLAEARILLDFADADENFNDKFQTALQNNVDAVISHNDALNLLAEAKA